MRFEQQHSMTLINHPCFLLNHTVGGVGPNPPPCLRSAMIMLRVGKRFICGHVANSSVSGTAPVPRHTRVICTFLTSLSKSQLMDLKTVPLPLGASDTHRNAVNTLSVQSPE
jgi:hypothetical protein